MENNRTETTKARRFVPTKLRPSDIVGEYSDLMVRHYNAWMNGDKITDQTRETAAFLYEALRENGYYVTGINDRGLIFSYITDKRPYSMIEELNQDYSHAEIREMREAVQRKYNDFLKEREVQDEPDYNLW